MIPFSVKQAWFWLALVGLAQCWLMLLVLGRKYGGLWGRLYYCLFVTLVEGIFSLGMIWHMDPKLMPHPFCIAQVVSFSLGSFALTGVSASFAVANALAVFRPQSFDTGRAILAWHPRYIPLVILFPLLATVLHASLLIKLNAVQPALADDMHCDITKPMWVRLFGYAGVPLAVSLPFLCLSLITAIRLIRVARSPRWKRCNGANGRDPWVSAYDWDVRNGKIAWTRACSTDDTRRSQSYELRVNSLSYNSGPSHSRNVEYTSENATAGAPCSRSLRFTAFLPYPTLPFLNRSTVGPDTQGEPEFTFVNVTGRGSSNDKEEDVDPFPLHQHPFPPGALTSSTGTGSPVYIGGSEEGGHAFPDLDTLDRTLARRDRDEQGHDHASACSRPRADSAVSSSMPVFAPNPHMPVGAPGFLTGSDPGTRSRSASSAGHGAGPDALLSSASGVGAGLASRSVPDTGNATPTDASLGAPGGHMPPTGSGNGHERTSTITNTTSEGDVQLGWAVTTEDAGLDDLRIGGVAGAGLEDSGGSSPIGLALTTDEPSLRHTPSPAAHPDPASLPFPHDAVAAYLERFLTSPGVGSPVSFLSPELRLDTEPERAATPTSASPMLQPQEQEQEQEQEHVPRSSTSTVISHLPSTRSGNIVHSSSHLPSLPPPPSATEQGRWQTHARTTSMTTQTSQTSKDTKASSHKLSGGGRVPGTSVENVPVSSSTTLHADADAGISAGTNAESGGGAETVDYHEVRLKLDALDRDNDEDTDYNDTRDTDGDYGSDAEDEDIPYDPALPLPPRRPVRTHTRALNPHFGVPLSLPLARDGVYNPTPPPWTASSTGVSDMRGPQSQCKRGEDEGFGAGLFREKGWKGLFWRDKESEWEREREKEDLQGGGRREGPGRKESNCDRKCRERGAWEARRLRRREQAQSHHGRRGGDEVGGLAGCPDGFEIAEVGAGGGTGAVATGSRVRREYGLGVAIWRLVFFQICFFTVQLLASLSSIIDVARGTITPFGTQHVALLLAAWGPLFIFGQVPRTWRVWRMWKD